MPVIRHLKSKTLKSMTMRVFAVNVYRTEVPKGQKQGTKRQDGDLNDKPGQFPVI
jgi:hypothetical protein